MKGKRVRLGQAQAVAQACRSGVRAELAEAVSEVQGLGFATVEDSDQEIDKLEGVQEAELARVEQGLEGALA